MGKCAVKNVNVTANDTDPEGNYPLSVVSAVGNGGMIATVVSGSTIEIEAPGTTGAKTVTYTVADSLGATATGTVTVTVSGGSCTL